MIELNKKTQQDFLNREWVQKLMDAGIDMSDAKYCIGRTFRGDYVAYKAGAYNETLQDIIPTYTVSELLYKLNEWPSLEIEVNGEKKIIGTPLEIIKDAPFYFACYHFSTSCVSGKEVYPEYKKYDIECESEYPIEALAQLLIASAKSNFLNFKYSKDISDK